MQPEQHIATPFWRPQFSMRTLTIVMTLACIYFGLWEVTKQWGCRDVSISSPMPFVVAADGSKMQTVDIGLNQKILVTRCRYYYIWFFGYEHLFWRT